MLARTVRYVNAVFGLPTWRARQSRELLWPGVLTINTANSRGLSRPWALYESRPGLVH
jgi:hypothetical protein